MQATFKYFTYFYLYYIFKRIVIVIQFRNTYIFEFLKITYLQRFYNFSKLENGLSPEVYIPFGNHLWIKCVLRNPFMSSILFLCKLIIIFEIIHFEVFKITHIQHFCISLYFMMKYARDENKRKRKTDNENVHVTKIDENETQIIKLYIHGVYTEGHECVLSRRIVTICR